MRTRIIGVAVLAAVVATVLFAVPLGAGAFEYLMQHERVHLVGHARDVALSVAGDVHDGAPIGLEDVEDLVGEEHRVIVYDGSGDRIAGSGPDAPADVVSDALDASEAMGEQAYTLEVSSPGTDRPLTLPRHWRRNVGRLVAVGVGPQGAVEQVTGRISAVDGDGVTLAVETKGKPGAKKRPPQPRQVPWGQLGAGRVQVEFGRAGAEPAAGADDDGGDQ